jgi:hypothetical protein
VRGPQGAPAVLPTEVTGLTRDELSAALLAARLEAGQVVYVERRGERYRWGTGPQDDDAAGPAEAWIYYTGDWPVDDDERWPAFFEDLLAEMDSMTGGADRCRWPLDDPWPSVAERHRH